MKLWSALFPFVAMLFAAVAADGAVITRGSYDISVAGRSSDEVGYDVDADGLIDFYQTALFLGTTDVPSSGTVFLTTFSQRTGFAFLKTANPFPQLQALPGSAEIGPGPDAGQWEQGRYPTSTISFGWFLYTPENNGYGGTFRGLEEAWVGYRLIREGETYYGALRIDLYQTIYDGAPEGGEVSPVGEWPGVFITASYTESEPNTGLNVASIPEPGAVALIAFGLVAASLSRWRDHSRK